MTGREAVASSVQWEGGRGGVSLRRNCVSVVVCVCMCACRRVWLTRTSDQPACQMPPTNRTKPQKSAMQKFRWTRLTMFFFLSNLLQQQREQK